MANSVAQPSSNLQHAFEPFWRTSPKLTTTRVESASRPLPDPLRVWLQLALHRGCHTRSRRPSTLQSREHATTRSMLATTEHRQPASVCTAPAVSNLVGANGFLILLCSALRHNIRSILASSQRLDNTSSGIRRPARKCSFQCESAPRTCVLVLCDPLIRVLRFICPFAHLLICAPARLCLCRCTLFPPVSPRWAPGVRRHKRCCPQDREESDAASHPACVA